MTSGWPEISSSSALSILIHRIFSIHINSPNKEADYAPENIIVRDVAIIGGGASGTYAAIRLQQDYNKSVLVVEQKDVLGGHTEAYHDPESGSTIDIGVIVYLDLPLVRNFFARFDIPLTTMFFNSQVIKEVDFRTGLPVSLPPTFDDTAAAFARYADQLARYPTLTEGYVFPDPIPDDLLLPFLHFVQKYNLTAILPSAWSYAQGYGDILNLPTVHVLKVCGPQILRPLSAGFLTTARWNNHEIYEKSLALLGNGTNVLLGSSIVAMRRDGCANYVDFLVRTPNTHTLVRARQVLFTIPPQLEGRSRFDLDRREMALFSKFQNFEYYTGLLRNVPITDNTTLINMAMDPLNFYLPTLPTTYFLGRTYKRSNLINVKFGSDGTLTLDQIQRQIIAETTRAVPGAKPEFVTFRNHSPFALRVSADEIKSGFYARLNQLQGRRRTWWTGAAWHAQDSGLLWNFTEGILAQMQRASDTGCPDGEVESRSIPRTANRSCGMSRKCYSFESCSATPWA
ncbi:uncharacterized protein N7459_004587 [Penicillium hispanicum]|uniref:uncharacterized protein n=1 Tax=Penicillium hispanicum TaxID=1080232 RepID=UPI0025422354|nr:uncharacterized protein N7459_004587 [Penicillium hispanicum]KAJ5584787.1 hypothetical protein N7459_004587 [Penicillium hispanicum]